MTPEDQRALAADDTVWERVVWFGRAMFAAWVLCMTGFAFLVWCLK